MLKRIFVHRANFETNKKLGNDALPTWWIEEDGILKLVHSFRCLGASWSVNSAKKPLEYEGGVHMWIETEGEVVVND